MTLPRLLLCGFTAFPAAPLNPAGAIVSAIAEEGWAPAGAQLETLLLPVVWDGAFEAVEARLAAGAFDGVMLVGVAATSQACRVERLARNIASSSTPDAAGIIRTSATVRAAGEETLAVTAPVDAMHKAIIDEGIACDLSDDAGDYLCNFTLYRVLEAAPGTPAGFLHIPQAVELGEGGASSLEVLERAVKAAAQAFAKALVKEQGLRA